MIDKQAEATIQELEQRVITWSRHAMLWRDRYEKIQTIAVDLQAELADCNPDDSINGTLYDFIDQVEQEGDSMPQEAELIEMVNRLTRAVQYLVDAVPTDIPNAANLLVEALPLVDGKKAG